MLKDAFMAHIRADEFGALAVHLYGTAQNTHMLSVTRQPNLAVAKELLLEKITHAPLLRAWVRRYFVVPDAPATPRPVTPRADSPVPQNQTEARTYTPPAMPETGRTPAQKTPPAMPETGRTPAQKTPPVALVRGAGGTTYLIRSGVWYPVDDIIALAARR